MSGPIAGIRVVDISERSPAAQIAGMVLADLGAEVIRVEPRGGDPVRALHGHRVWLRGQKSVVLGTEQVRDGSWARLRESADLIIDTAQPWTDKPAGLLKDWKPGRGQVVSILTATPMTVEEALTFDRSTSSPVYGELIEGQLDLQDLQRGYREGPIFLGWPHAAYGGAWMLIIGALSALYEREKTGEGQVLTTSLVDGVMCLTANLWSGNDPAKPPALRPAPGASQDMLSARRTLVGLQECSDGKYVQLHTMAKGAFDRLMHAVGREDLVDPSITSLSAPMDPVVYKDMRESVSTSFLKHPAQWWFDTLAKADFPCMIANPQGDILFVDQPILNGMVDAAQDGLRQMGKIGAFSRTQIEIGRRIPTPGEDTTAILSSAKPLQAPKAKSSPATGRRVGPLDGVTILDMGFFLAGPYANKLFADLGARVIKVEDPNGDPYRTPTVGWYTGHRGKEDIAVDLKSEGGRDFVYDLVRKADVVHHNMRAAPLTRLGIDYETLSVINPRLIYCHSSGYGNVGPWAKLPTFEPLHSAAAGLMYRTAGEGNAPMMYLSHMDYGAGLTSCSMVLAALAERERSGKGQYIEVPQTGAGILAMSDVYFEDGKKYDSFPLDKQQRGHAPTNALYQTKGGWIIISCYSDKEWQGVPKALGIPMVGWPDYAAARKEQVGVNKPGAAIDAAVAGMTTIDVQRRLEAEGVPCVVPVPVSPARVIGNQQYRQMGLIVLEKNEEIGSFWELGHTIRFGHRTDIHARAGPVLGQDTVRILKETGRTDAQIEALVASKAVRQAWLAT